MRVWRDCVEPRRAEQLSNSSPAAVGTRHSSREGLRESEHFLSSLATAARSSWPAVGAAMKPGVLLQTERKGLLLRYYSLLPRSCAGRSLDISAFFGIRDSSWQRKKRNKEIGTEAWREGAQKIMFKRNSKNGAVTSRSPVYKCMTYCMNKSQAEPPNRKPHPLGFLEILRRTCSSHVGNIEFYFLLQAS